MCLQARRRIAARLSESPAADEPETDGTKVNKFLYTTLKLNAIIMRYSRMAAVVLVSLPPPPNQPAHCYMEYMDCLVAGIPRLLMVRGYRREVVTIFS